MPDLNNLMASGVYAPNVNKLFVFGGERASSATVVDTTRIYDIATNTWSTGAPMPDVRAFMASGYYNGKIYLVGGYSTGSVAPAFLQTWEYDPVANTFATKTSIPASTGFGGAGSGVVNGHLYVAGGRDASNTVIATTWDYDIAANTWTARANLPASVNVPGSAAIGGKLWIFGGGSPFADSDTMPTSANKELRAWFNRLLHPDTTNALELYDPATNTWSSGPSLNHPRSFPASTHVGNTAVAVGGYSLIGPYITNSVEINVAGGSCAPVPSSAVSRKVHGAFTGDINLPVVAIGGAVGIECRNGAGVYQMVVTFPSPVTVGEVSVTSGTGSVGSSIVSGGVVTINLTGVTDAQRLGVTLANVNDGTSTGDVFVPMGVLIGDSAGTGNGSVNAGDVGFVKSQSGIAVGAGNFRADVAINGTINASDIGLVNSNSGHSLPP